MLSLHNVAVRFVPLALLSSLGLAAPPNLPDLQIDYITLDDDNALVVAIANDNNAFVEVPAGVGSLRVFVDENKVFDEPLAALGDQTFLQIGGQTVVNTGIRLSGRTRHVLAFVDPDDEIEEFDEFQNRMSLALDTEPAEGYDFAILARLRSEQLEISLTNKGSVASPEIGLLDVRVFVDDVPYTSFVAMLESVQPDETVDVVPPTAIFLEEPVNVRVTCRVTSYNRELDETNNVFETTMREVSFNSVVADYTDLLIGRIGDHMYWEGSPSFAGFGRWPRQMRDMLIDHLHCLELGWPLPIQGPPEVLYVDPNGDGTAIALISPEDARQAYVAHVAHSLWYQKRGGVSWSLNDLADEELEKLFDSRDFILYVPETDQYGFSAGVMGTVTAWHPQFAFNFLKHAGILAHEPDTVVYRLGAWIRAHCIHSTGQHLVPSREEYFGYLGYVPLERVPFPIEASEAYRHRSIGCKGTSGVIGAFLRPVNIPVVRAQSCLGVHADGRCKYHSRVELPTILKEGAPSPGITVHHSDDFYNKTMRTRGILSIPTWEIFYSFDERDRWLTDPDLPLDCREEDPSDCNRYGEQTKYNFERFLHLVARRYLPEYHLRSAYSDAPTVVPLEELLTGPFVKPYLDEDERNDFAEAAEARIIEIGDGDYDAGVEILEQLHSGIANRTSPSSDVPPGENRPPSIQPLADQHVEVFDTVSLEITASDPDGDDLELDVIDAPPGSTLEDGVFEWRVGDQAGIHNLVFTASDGRGGVARTDVLITVAGSIWRTSVATSGAEGNGSSLVPGLSADGRFVVFTSDASNLIEADLNGELDVFVHDRDPDEDGVFRGLGTTDLVSVSSNGIQGDASSTDPDISANGRIVAFESRATTLVPDDTNLKPDVFVRDVTAGDTWRVSVDSAGVQADDDSFSPSVSSDGRYVAFASAATNLVQADTNGVIDVFVHDRATGETSRVSVQSDGRQANDSSTLPSISADGRFITFQSAASDLVEDDNNFDIDMFAHDRLTGETSRVSIADDESEASGPAQGRPSISAGGRFVAFASEAANLVDDDTNGSRDVFVRDRVNGRTIRVSVRSGGDEANEDSWSPTISAQGRYVAFHSRASNLVSGDTNGQHDVFIHGLDTGRTVRVSLDAVEEQADSDSFTHGGINAVSGDERFVVFQSDATNLVANDRNGEWDVFVRRIDQWREPLGGDDRPPSRIFVQASLSDDRGVPPGSVLTASGTASYGEEPVVFGTVTVTTTGAEFEGELAGNGTFAVEFTAPETDGVVTVTVAESVYGLSWSEPFALDIATGDIPTLVFVDATLSVDEDVPPGTPIEVIGSATYDVDNDNDGENDPVTEGFVVVENGREATPGSLELDGTFVVEFPAPCEDRNVEVFVHEEVYGLDPGTAELPIDIIPVFFSTTWLCGDGTWSDSGCWSVLSAGDDYPDIDCGATYDVYLPPGNYTVDVGPADDDEIVVQELIIDERADLDVGTAGDLAFTVDERLVSLGTIVARRKFRTAPRAPAFVDESSLIATAGGRIDLPTVTSYTVVAMDGDRYLEADGFNSYLGLPALASIVNNDDVCCDNEVFVRAVNGGEVDLSGLRSASGVGDSRGDVIISVSGPISTMQLPQLVALNRGSSLSVSDGGTANTSATFATVVDASLSVSGASSTIDLSGLSTVISSRLDFGGALHFSLPLVLDIFDSRLTIAGSADIDLDNVVSIDQAGIRMGSGSALTLPLATSYSVDQMDGDRYLEAAGPGAYLGLPVLEWIVNNDDSCCDDEVFVRALDGGMLDLSSLRFAAGVGGSRGDVILSVGPTGVIELQQLNALNPGSSLTVEDGGRANTTSEFTTLLGTTLTIAGPNAQIDLSGISTITSSILNFGNGTQFAFPLVVDIFDSKFSIEGTAEIDLSHVVSFDQASIRMWSGSSMSLPLATTYTADDSAGARYLTADGPGSFLGLPALESMTNVDATCCDEELYVTASNGGHVDLSALRSTRGQGGNRGDVVLTVSGPSTMDLSSLTNMNVGTIVKIESGAELELPSDLMLSSMWLSVGSGCRLTGGGDFLYDMTDPAQFDWAATSEFRLVGGTAAPDCDAPGYALLEVGGADIGNEEEGFSGNFEIPHLVIGGDAHVRLVDEFDNREGEGTEALYVVCLEFADSEGRLLIDGINLYYGELIGSEAQIVPSVQRADVDCDGDVDFDDLVRVLSRWGPCPDCPEDINGDDVVDFDDLLEILSNWGARPAPRGGLARQVDVPSTVERELSESKEEDPISAVADVFVNDGVLATTDYAGVIPVSGDYRQTLNGELVVRVDGPVPIDDYGLLLVDGRAALGGSLTIALPDGADVRVGDAFTIVAARRITGAFDEVRAIHGIETSRWEIVYGANRVQLIAVEPRDSDVIVERSEAETSNGAEPHVDVGAFWTLLERWGKAGSEADVNGDGIVDGLDVMLLLER